MAHKKISKASKKRLAIFGSISIIIIFYFIFTLGFYMYHLYDKKQEKQQFDKEYNNLKTEEKLLKTEIEKLQDEDYIARFAREHYSYSKSGEYILKLNNKEEEKQEEKQELHLEYNYFIYGGFIFLLITIFYIIKKRN